MEFGALLIRVCPDSTFLFPLRASTAPHCAFYFYVEGSVGMTASGDQEPIRTALSTTTKIGLAIRLGLIGLLAYWRFE